MGAIGLSLLAGPANAGKVALLLERYLGALDSDPVLIVPNRPDVDRAERELLRHAGALVGGSIGTFDDLFERLARSNGAHRPVVTEAQRTLLLRRVVAGVTGARSGVLGRSARFAGFADALGQTVSELESGLLEPGELEGELAELYQAYRDELDRLGAWDRELERRHAAERIAGELDAWDCRPVFAYGFEDLTGAEWSLLEALAARSEVAVSLPYEPARDAFASLSRTSDDLNALAERREELPPNPAARGPVLTHLERAQLRQTPFGQALLSLLRYAWLDGERRDLFSFLRSPYSGVARHHAHFLEGRLRGRAVSTPARIEEEIQKLRAQPLPHLEALRSSDDPVTAVGEVARKMVEAAYTLQSPPTSDGAQLDLRAQASVARQLRDLKDWQDRGQEVTREESVGLLEQAVVRMARPEEAGRVAVLDLLRARTRRFEVVFLLGLEEGRLPRRALTSPFLDEEQKAELERSSRSGRLLRTDPVSRDRYLFYTACTRPTRRLYLVREAATDDGAPRQASPFLDETRRLYAPDEVHRWP